MNCTECQELIAIAARDQLPPQPADAHLARCRTCQMFAGEMEAVAWALHGWKVPVAETIEIG